VYIPLGGSRVERKSRLVFNLFVVWSLTGIWHGANWTFIAWGIFYFVLLTFEKLTGFEEKYPGPAAAVIKRIYVLLAVIAGWVIFRADNISHAVEYLGVMSGLYPVFGDEGVRLFDNNSLRYFMEYSVFFAAGIMFSTPVAKLFSGGVLRGLVPVLRGLTPVLRSLVPVCYIVLYIVSVSYIAKGSHNPFIYFNF